MDHISHVFSMEEIVGQILKFLPMKELHRVARSFMMCGLIVELMYGRRLLPVC